MARHRIGNARSIPLDTTQTFHLGGRKHHFDLLADPTVYEQLRDWLRATDDVTPAGEDAESP